MKKFLMIFFTLVLFIGLVGCELPQFPSDEDDGIKEIIPGAEPGTGPTIDPIDEPDVEYLTVTEAYNLALQVGEAGTADKQYVYGTIKNITNSNYGEMYITDGTTDLYIYGVYSEDGTLRYPELAEKPYSGDVVYLYGVLKTYNDKPEMGASWLQKFTHIEQEVNLEDYSESTISAARASAVDSKLIVEGVVAQITYADGMNPNGLFLVDETGSIYVYSLEIAGRVKIGQKVKLGGTLVHYILESEIANANTFGYQGSIQLQEAVFISATEETYDFNTAWMKERTIKQILETPMSNNITTEIFKVTAIVNEVPGVGFTNYYIDDLDNETGSYCYSLNNGKDYSYLKEFDGKICEIYLTALNCKATKSGTIYRFVPIKVEAIAEFTMSDEEKASFTLEYYAEAQFLKEYNSDPNLVVKTSFSNEYIPFEGVEVSYLSTNTDLINFVEEETGLVMHVANGNEKVEIKMTAKCNDAVVERSVELSVNTKEIPDTISIADAIAAEDGTVVTVRGIVMSGTVNQPGFYLNDGTGVIAVTTDAVTLGTVALGNEIIVKGTKNHRVKTPDTMVGQINIENAVVEVNLLGNHEFDITPFITDLSFDEIKALISNVKVDQTTNVFVAKCYINKVEGPYSTNFYLASASNGQDIYLYAGSGSQYSIYNSFVGKEVTVTFVFVNWNSKTPYRACIVTATDGETVILNNYNFR